MMGVEMNGIAETGESLRFFLTAREWWRGLLFAGCAAAVTAPFTMGLSPWIAVTVFIVVLTGYHMKGASHFMVPLPHIAIMISALQYVLAAWWSVYVPSSIGTGAIVGFYLSYAGPVIVAVALGWSLALLRMRPQASGGPSEPAPGLLRELDALMLVGLAAAPISHVLGAPSLAFVFVLVGNLRYVGAFGRMILRAPGWPLRLGLVLVAELVFAADAAMFHPLLLWVAWSFAVWLYCFKPSARIVGAAFAIALLFLPSFQEAKWRLRGQVLEFDAETGVASESEEEGGSPIKKATAFVLYLGEGLLHSLTLNFTPDFVADTLTRYNQGWIITNVMIFVPDREPYAMGETLTQAVKASLLPRFADPEKAVAGGRDNMARYAGVVLDEKTSMNLGYAGEMYANFGYGGILGSGIYVVVFGLLFRFVTRRAFANPMWWSTVPFLFFAVLKAEDGIAEILNWTSKSAFVIIGVLVVFPHFRRALFRRSEPQRSDTQRVAIPPRVEPGVSF
ncbi:MAG TPA: hypothetical protein VM940_03960 [Chthoniobacterales bacterium]|jgi:hypothetical protein|nr:hypothetical protein [Chthoniobacterales bacterium]